MVLDRKHVQHGLQLEGLPGKPQSWRFCMDVNSQREISERLRKELKLRSSEEEYEMFLEALMSRMTRTNQKCNVQ